MVGRQWRSNPSPPIVSAKLEYLRIWPETFVDFSFNFAQIGSREKTMREKPGFSAPFSGVFGSLSERCTAWPGREDLNLQIAESKCPIVSRPLCLDDRPLRAICGHTPFRFAAFNEQHASES
jgi:hypothetical protein